MADQSLVSPAELRKLLACDPATGELTWRQRPLEMFPLRRAGRAWNTKYAGARALDRIDASGYRSGTVFNRKVYAHRAVIALITGAWPDSVDHINGDRSDNRIENLRSVNHATNLRNTKRRADNMSGHCGVFWIKRDRKWQAKIRVDQRQIYLGRFERLDDAVTARKEAEVLYGFHENHGRAE